MTTDRLAQITQWTGDAIRDMCLTQGWPSDAYEHAVTFNTRQAQNRTITVWAIMVSIDSGLVGKPPIELTDFIPGPRPTMEQVLNTVAGLVVGCWQARLAVTGATLPKRRVNGHRPDTVIVNDPQKG